MNGGIFVFLVKCAIASSLIPLILGLIKLRLRPLYLKLLLGLCVTSFVCDIVGIYTHKNYAGNIYRLIEFLLIISIFYKAFDNKKLKTPLALLGLLFVGFFLLNLLFLQQEKINTYTNTISALVFIVFSIAFFYRLMKDMPTERIHQMPMFWINISVLVYFAGNFFLFAINHYLINTLKVDLQIYWTFHNLLLVIRNMSFAVAFWMNLKMINSRKVHSA